MRSILRLPARFQCAANRAGCFVLAEPKRVGTEPKRTGPLRDA